MLRRGGRRVLAVHRLLLDVLTVDAALARLVGVGRLAAVVVVLQRPLHHLLLPLPAGKVLLHRLRLEALLEREHLTDAVLVVVAAALGLLRQVREGGVLPAAGEGGADLAELDEVDARRLRQGLLLHALQTAVQAAAAGRRAFRIQAGGRGGEGAGRQRGGQSRGAERRVQVVRGGLRRQRARSVRAGALSVAGARVGRRVAVAGAVVVVVVVMVWAVVVVVVVVVMVGLYRQRVLSHAGVDLLRKHTQTPTRQYD